MRRIIFAIALAASSLSLASCDLGGAIKSVPTSPSQVADRTVIDEQGMQAVELAYKASRLAVETGVDAGFIRGPAAAKFAVLDNKAYAALGVLRGAYRTANAKGYGDALTNARQAVTDLFALTGK